MKKLLFLLFASLLVLGACGQNEESTSKEETTKKTESKEGEKGEERESPCPTGQNAPAGHRPTVAGPLALPCRLPLSPVRTTRTSGHRRTRSSPRASPTRG